MSDPLPIKLAIVGPGPSPLLATQQAAEAGIVVLDARQEGAARRIGFVGGMGRDHSAISALLALSALPVERPDSPPEPMVLSLDDAKAMEMIPLPDLDLLLERQHFAPVKHLKPKYSPERLASANAKRQRRAGRF